MDFECCILGLEKIVLTLLCWQCCKDTEDSREDLQEA